MMTVNRQGISIEQCEGCRGIFLDRGELEQIIGAEHQHYGAAPPYAGGYGDSPPPYRGGHAPHGGRYGDSPPPYGRGRRKRSFLEGLFD